MTLVKKGIMLVYFKCALTLIFNYKTKCNKYSKCNKNTGFEKKLYSQVINEIKYQKFTAEIWSKWYSQVEKAFMNDDIKFLQNKTIRNTMFVRAGGRWQKTQLKYLESIIDNDKLQKLLKENCVGYPTITSFKYNSSHNLIHHLYHLVKFQYETGCDIDSLSTVVEFGGGYGSMCRLIKRLNFNSTYIIIDLPVFSFIQLYYLKSIYGEGEVNIILSMRVRLSNPSFHQPLSFDIWIASLAKVNVVQSKHIQF